MQVKVLAPATSAVALSESFYFEEFMKVTYTRNRLAGEKLPRTGRERALAGSTVAHQLRRTPSEGGEGWVKIHQVTAGMVIKECLEWDLLNCESRSLWEVKSNQLMDCDQD